MGIWAAQLSSLTHPYPMNRILCCVYCELVYFAFRAECCPNPTSTSQLRKMDKEWLAEAFAWRVDQIRIPSDGGRKYILEVVNRFKPYTDIKAWAAKAAPDQKVTGSALDAFEAALWCFFTRGTFREGAVEAVSLGGDSAAIGATYGALAGAFYGYEMIPTEWISEIQTPEMLEDVADGLEELRQKHLADGLG